MPPFHANMVAQTRGEGPGATQRGRVAYPRAPPFRANEEEKGRGSHALACPLSPSSSFAACIVAGLTRPVELTLQQDSRVVADSRVAKGGCGSHGPACGEAEMVGTRGVGAQWALLASAGETEATEGMGLAEAQLVGRLFTMSVAGIVAAARREKPRPRVSQKWLKVDVTSIMQHLNSFNKRKREQLPNTPQKRIMLSIVDSDPVGPVPPSPPPPPPCLVKKPTCPKKTVHHANARYASVPERTSRLRLARVLIGVRWHSISSCENCVHESSTNIEGLGPGPEDTLGNRAASATEAEEVLPDTP
ncbi:hypothetical protein EDB85DRAFT_1895411 [Lactarius pseudohatsudake]|nr:hypothetical protein EDB85DRAFT_1895411 [Lactarius pseudohatsudake]